MLSPLCPPLAVVVLGSTRARPYTQYSGLCVPPFVVVYTFRRRRVQFNYAGGGRVHTHEHTTLYINTHTHTHTHEQPRVHSKGNIETLTMAPPLCGVCVSVCVYIYIHTHTYTPLLLLYIPASSRATVPAEFKHINKRRKRNQQGFP